MMHNVEEILDSMNELSDTTKALSEVNFDDIEFADAASLVFALDMVNRSIKTLNKITKDIIVKDSIRKYMRKKD